jgi:thiol-disulfide isomerase/thioredoxin
MKKHLTLLPFFVVILISDVYTQNQSIVFLEKPWAEIVKEAQKQKKMIFLDAYTTWCGPCKWMAANIFTNDTVAAFYNKNFICSHFDMEKGEGLELARKYQVRAYPTLLFLDPASEVVHVRVGAPRKAKDYVDMGNVALTPGEGYSAYVKRYNEGERSPEFMLNFFDRLQGAYQPVTEPLSAYFQTQKDEDLLSAVNWQIINNFVWDMNAREFQYLLKHRAQFSTAYTKQAVDAKITSVFNQALYTLARSQAFNENAYNTLKESILASGFEEAAGIIENFEQTIRPANKK